MGRLWEGQVWGVWRVGSQALGFVDIKSEMACRHSAGADGQLLI